MNRTTTNMALGALAAAFFIAIPTGALAVECSFTRDLSIGLAGEDVRCLQRYLESYEYTTGIDARFYDATTQEAVARFQKTHGVRPADGSFGLASRLMYYLLASALPPYESVPVAYVPHASSSYRDEQEAYDAVLAAHARIREVAVDGAHEPVRQAAEMHLFAALRAFIDERYDLAEDRADRATELLDALVDRR